MSARISGKRIAMIKAQDGHLIVTRSDGPAMKVQSAGTPCISEVKEYLANADPELIFLDLNLPVALGANLLKIVRETSSGKRVVLRPLENAGLQGLA